MTSADSGPWLCWVGNDGEAQLQIRAHFFSVAAEAMRHILFDRTRRKQAARHGGGQQRLNLDDREIAASTNDDGSLAVNDALERLAQADQRFLRLAQ